MFPTVESAADDRDAVIAPPPEDLIPLSHLELDLPAPVEGWSAFFAGRDIPVQADDLGRAAVARSVARMLFAEQRELAARAAELRAQQEARLIEESQRMHASLPKGLPWWKVGPLSPAEALVQLDYANRPKSVRQQMLDDELAGRPGGLVYQSLQDGAGES